MNKNAQSRKVYNAFLLFYTKVSALSFMQRCIYKAGSKLKTDDLTQGNIKL